MLGFIHGIDSFNKSLIENNPHNHPQKSDDPPSSKETMYLRFLLYKILYMADKPLIICEGKTDNVYLTHAIRSLSAKFPQLVKVDAEGKTVINVRLFKYTDKSTGRIFGIESGGAPGLSKLMRSYFDEVKKFKAPGAKQPVIVLVDNDTGATKKGNVFGTFANLTHQPKPTGHEPFLHVIKNLYVVATPLNGKATSCSEDFFGDDAKSIPYEGKEFDPTCPKDSKTHYNSKSTFAYDVVVPNAAVINFDKFAPLLQNLVAAIDFHAAKTI